MHPSVAAVYDMVTAMDPVDNLEAEHQAHVRSWLVSTDDVFRRVKPAEPPEHLVSYVVPVDPATGDVLLVDHVNARLWLPPGGHVEVGEHPAVTAAREISEELGIDDATVGEPLFLTVTRTVGVDAGHTDVSLWFVLALNSARSLRPDQGEFAAVRWWTRAELESADRSRFDPHLFRFLGKLRRPGF
ncbi:MULTISPECIES: NUDIX hydrolase [Actinoplanes]|uniref:NUDIX domain-containing protein n=1 Tax=Actinoplanes TaxID=1865 RepID=UPI0005F2C5CA|nr:MULTISPECIES: NUDIX hydrolase [Actinoplanes]GLX99730.1 DNA mismatch repair protein MutT [Actinoplanes sp. NBRC 101535]